MATPRNEVFRPRMRWGIYHCYTQCVRQLYLLGDDPQTQVTNDHRRQYFIGTLKRLAASMAVDVLDFAVMGNHVPRHAAQPTRYRHKLERPRSGGAVAEPPSWTSEAAWQAEATATP